MAATDGVAIGRFSVRLAQLLRTTALCLEEENLLLDDRVVLEHAQRSMLARSDQSLVVTGQGHGDDAHRDGA